MPSPSIFNKRSQGPSRRQRAHDMFLSGATLDEVIKALDLKRTTAGAYLFEARCMNEARNKELMK